MGTQHTRYQSLGLWLPALLCGAFLAASAAAQPPDIETRGDRHPAVRRGPNGSFIFRNTHLVAVLTHGERGYESLYLYPATRATELPSPPVATVPELVQLAWREGETSRRGTFVPTDARFIGDHGLKLLGTVKDGSTSWEVVAELDIGVDPWLSWTVKVQPSAPAGLTRLAPLPLRVGREGPREAIFPGLAYLEEGEGSGTAPASKPLVPDPYKITIPAMAFAQYGTTVGMLWDNTLPWGGPGYPAALFDSPAPGSEGSTRMEIFLPSVPRFVHENEEEAAEPYALQASQDLSLSGKIVVLPDEVDASRAIREWAKAYGFPKMEGYPRPLSLERRVCRDAYLGGQRAGGDQQSAAGSQQSAGATRDRAFAALALLMDAGLSPAGKTRSELRSLAEQRISELQSQGPLDSRLAFRVGGMLPALQAERERVSELMRQQLGSGGWPWETATSGPNELGAVTARALPILRYAALSGDSSASGAALKALEYLSRQFRLPKAGQGGEAPPHAPSLLVAAEAAECLLLGYRISGEERYMNSARYWADTGLPFIYFWREKERPALQHASIPSFGGADAGVAEQWVGLVYARVLRWLSRIRPDPLYDFVSEGILSSAMRQQYTGGGDAGLIPERWNVRENRGEGGKLTPDLLLAVLYVIEDLNTEVSHIRVRVGPDRMFAASGAMIHQADTSSMRLRLKLRWLKGDDTFTTVTGVLAKPLSVQYNSNPLRSKGIPLARHFLPEVDGESQRGWYYDPDAALLILRLPHTGDDDHLEIRWPDPRERSPIDRVDTKVKPGRG